MDKILTSMSGGDITITNDGATILRSLHVDNAAAKVLVDIARVQDEDVGDGPLWRAVAGGGEPGVAAARAPADDRAGLEAVDADRAHGAGEPRGGQQRGRGEVPGGP